MNERKSMTTMSKESLRLNPEGDRPLVDPTAYVDPSAQLILSYLYLGHDLQLGSPGTNNRKKGIGYGTVR